MEKQARHLEAMDVEERSLELLPMDVQHILLGKLNWTALATIACASKHFLGLVCQSCAHCLGLEFAKTISIRCILAST